MGKIRHRKTRMTENVDRDFVHFDQKLKQAIQIYNQKPTKTWIKKLSIRQLRDLHLGEYRQLCYEFTFVLGKPTRWSERNEQDRFLDSIIDVVEKYNCYTVLGLDGEKEYTEYDVSVLPNFVGFLDTDSEIAMVRELAKILGAVSGCCVITDAYWETKINNYPLSINGD